MPSAKISDAHGLSVELEANEASIADLGQQALDLLAKASAIVGQRSAGSEGALGFGTVGTSRTLADRQA